MFTIAVPFHLRPIKLSVNELPVTFAASFVTNALNSTMMNSGLTSLSPLVIVLSWKWMPPLVG